jgi:hypothetical protein
MDISRKEKKRLKGVEPSSRAWEARVIAVIRQSHYHNIIAKTVLQIN